MLDFIKIKNFYSLKDIVKQLTRKVTKWEKCFHMTYQIKDFCSKYIFLKPSKLNNKKTIQLKIDKSFE